MKATEYYYNLAKSGEWPPWLMTFELWCHITGYERGQPKGGPKFQKMMLNVLGYPHKYSKVTPGPHFDEHRVSALSDEVGYMWDADAVGDARYGKMFVKEPEKKEWYMGVTASGTPILADSRGKTASTAHIGKSARPTWDFIRLERQQRRGMKDTAVWGAKPGMPIGIFSNNTQGLCYNLNHSASIETNPGFAVYGKLDWEVKANIQGKNEQKIHGEHNTWMGHGTDKEDHTGCWEITKPYHKIDDGHGYWWPCPLFANRAAMIFGLYYYPGCDDNDYHWDMQEKVGGETFLSRGRCPNPHYGEPGWYSRDEPALDLQHQYLYVYEENNKYNRDELKKTFDSVYDRYGRRSDDPGKKDSEPDRPAFDTLGGVFAHDFDSNGVLKPGVRNRMFVPKTSHFQERSGHHWLSYWYFLLWPYEKNDTTAKPLPPRSIVNPYYINSSTHKVIEGKEKHRQRGVDLDEVGLKMVTGTVDSVDFGFAISQTLLLYPHARTHSNVTFHRFRKDAAPRDARTPGFIPKPRVRQGFTLPSSEDVVQGYAVHILEGWDDFSKMDSDAQRLYLLSKSDDPPPTQRPVDPPLDTRPNVTVSEAGPSEESVAGADIDTMPEGVDANATTEDGSMQNTDQATASTTRAVRTDQRREVQLYFGYDGFELANALRECDDTFKFTDAEVKRYATLKDPRNSKDKKMKEIDDVMKRCDFKLATMPEGTTSMGKQFERGFHWPTALHAPWHFEQLYKLPTIQVKPGGQELKDSVKLQWGEANSWGDENLFDQYLTSPLPGKEDLFAINFAKILVIYYSDTGVGPAGPGLDPVQKRLGMLNGIDCHPDTTEYTFEYPTPREKPRKPQGVHALWNRVFESDPFEELDSDVADCFEAYVGDLEHPNKDPRALQVCLEDLAAKKNLSDWKHLLRGVKSKMTIAEWVTTPWHLEHLPYTQQYSTFKDSEGYSEGCKRCCRRFYEYPYHVYADGVGTKVEYSGFANDLWLRRDKVIDAQQKAKKCRLSPIPLHDPQFWSESGNWKDARVAVPGHIRRDLSAVEPPAGPVEAVAGPNARGNWHHYLLPVTLLNSKEQARRPVLKSKGIQPNFRRYINMAYRNDVADSGEYGSNDVGFYKGLTQGYMFMGALRKARYGDEDTRLMRSHKYGNTCRDCALVLEKVGLFVRNNRHTYDAGIVFGAKDVITRESNWWEWMGKGMDGQVLDDLLVFKGKGKAAQIVKDGGQAALDRAQKRAEDAIKKLWDHLKQTNTRALPAHLSRIAKPPSLHIQKSVHHPEQDRDKIAKAFEDFEAFVSGGDLSRVDRTNPAARLVRRREEQCRVEPDDDRCRSAQAVRLQPVPDRVQELQDRDRRRQAPVAQVRRWQHSTAARLPRSESGVGPSYQGEPV